MNLLFCFANTGKNINNYKEYKIMKTKNWLNCVLIKLRKWLTPAYDAETQAEVKRMLEKSW